MQQKFDPNATVNIPCPQCGDKTAQTIATLQLSPRLRCPSCGVLFKVDFRKLAEKLKNVRPTITTD
jgi:uncharacterized Zn finger protein